MGAGSGPAVGDPEGASVPLEPAGDVARLASVVGVVVEPSGAPVPDSELFGREVAVAVTCGPLFSDEHAAVPTTMEPASATAASLSGMPPGFLVPVMSTA